MGLDSERIVTTRFLDPDETREFIEWFESLDGDYGIHTASREEILATGGKFRFYFDEEHRKHAIYGKTKWG